MYAVLVHGRDWRGDGQPEWLRHACGDGEEGAGGHPRGAAPHARAREVRGHEGGAQRARGRGEGGSGNGGRGVMGDV
eukprot:5294784-Prymnesium_polylepis.1